VGYAGGQTERPTYMTIGDHTETVQIDYDPLRISYDDLLAVFWNSHDPSGRAWSRQYLNAIFFHDEGQRQTALASKKARESVGGRAVHTEVLPVRSFTLAEDYHQKYLLKRRTDLMRELSRLYPEHTDFVNSTAVARINGYVGGYGSQAQLLREIDMLGLSPAARKTLLDLVGERGAGGAG
jgi:peptide-methionine (S)-S-oxide reductase